MASATDIMAQITTLWRKLSAGQRIGIVTTAAVVVGGMILAASFAGNPEYVQLATGLAANRSQEIIARLDESGADYVVIGDGATILVNRKDLAGARQTLGRNGLGAAPAASDDEPGLFGGAALNKREQRFAETRKLERQLADNLMKFEFVELATVTLTPEVQRYYKGGDQPAKATVQISPKGTLSDHQIMSIAHTLAAGVEGLSADMVAISDARGIILKTPQDSSMTGAVSAQLKYRLEIERLKTMQAQEALDLVYGPHKVVVQVSAELDWTRSQIRETKYDPEAKVIRERRKNDSSRTTPSRVPGGAVGTNGVNNGQAGDSGAGSQIMTTVDEKADFNSTESEQVTMGGDLKRLSIGVWVDESLSSAEEDIRRTVGASIGFMQGRDEISLHITAIQGPAIIDMEAEKESAESQTAVFAYLEYGVYGLLGAGFILFSLRTIKKAKASLHEVLERSLEEEKAPEPPALTLEQSVLAAMHEDSQLAGRTLKRWLYETAE